jgi:dTDP-4-amino-4,6-dideoxygalactose transaminase
MERKINLFETVPTGTEIDAIREVLDSHWWGSGKKAREFEDKFAEYVGAKYAIATNSCTSALDIAVQVAPLGEEVSVSPFTFVSSALAILRAGKKVKFVDIDTKSYCTPNADIQVLYAGNDSGEGIIYDMAHFGGGKHKGLISCWSFQARKNLPTGDGGMITTNDEALYKRMKALSWCGIDKSTLDRSKDSYSWDYDIQEVGFKADMTDIVATIGLEQLKFLDINNKKRAQIASWYDIHLPTHVERPFRSTTWHLYTIQVPNRDELYKKLAENGVSAGIHYKPLYKYPIFPQEVLPNTESVFQHILSLPMHVNLDEEQVKYVCSLI